MKKILLLMLCSASLHAMPAKRTPTVISQPDGTKFSAVGFGDEYYNYMETLDGYVVIQGSDEYWYYATLSPEGRFTPSMLKIDGGDVSQNRMIANIPKHLRESREVIAEKLGARHEDRNIGEGTLFRSIQKLDGTQNAVKHVLLLCVQFPNIAATQTSASFQDMVNNDNWKSGTGGMSKYYKDVSYNTVSIQADYRNWITASHQSAYYAYNNGTVFWTHVRELVRDCIDAAEAGGVDFSLYDNDGDGTVDGLFVVHAGIGAEEGGQTQYIWSHSGSLGATYERTYDGKSIDSYIIMPELYGTNHVDIGVFCHEYGHMLGLPDLYDADGATNGASEGLGNWCLMAGGSWGGNGSTPDRPSHMSAYCKELLGFATPTIIASSQALSIPQAETNAFAYKIWMDGNQSDEYVLIENRQQTGFDVNLPGSGLLMYHVDKNLADLYPASNGVNVTNTHLGVKLYEADGLEQLAGAVNRGNAGDPYPGSTGNTSLTSSTTPNTNLWNTNPSGVAITGISASSATMTATAVVPIYYGYGLQFYRKVAGWSYGSPTSSIGYAMVKCTPTFDGKLIGVRVFSYAGRYTSLVAAAFSNFSSNVLSSQVGNSVSGSSPGIDNFVQLDFSPEIDVTQGVPIYLRVFFQQGSVGYPVPIDISLPSTGNSYYSGDGTTFSRITPDNYDVAVRVVFRSNIALPVELTSFAANSTGSMVTLRWETASEKNNFGFEVEKDTVRIRQMFNVIPGSFVQGQGTTLVPHTYTFTDSNATAGKWAYRLKQIDLDGSVHVFEPALVDLMTTDREQGLEVPTVQQNYPNPFNPATTIRYGLPDRSPVTLAVFNTLGQQVAILFQGEQEGGYHEVRFDATGLSSGVYFYRLTAGNFVETRKLLVIR